MIIGFPAPPAQQASSDDLLGERGQPANVGLDGPANDNADLPLTARVRRLADPIEAALVITALFVLALMVVPFLLDR